ncbi:zinc transporter ZIP10-like [Tachypleus tridentatus]|uniref:zinc transporter ZIP10-like n=1 Tax=Tachypleus tridentatus TaxID=6853 RepID=UPI003FD36B65
MCSCMTGLFCACLFVSCCITCKFLGSEGHHHHHHHRQRRVRSLNGESEDHVKTMKKKLDHHIFLKEIFDRYGHNEVITFEGFKELLENLGVGHKVQKDYELSSHKNEEKGFHDTVEHDHHEVEKSQEFGLFYDHHKDEIDHSHSQANSIGDSHFNASKFEEMLDNTTSLDTDGGDVLDQLSTTVTGTKCLTSSEFLNFVDVQPGVEIKPVDFLNICPAIILKLDQHPCENSFVHSTHVHHMVDKKVVDKGHNSFSPYAWGYATISVIVISLCGLLSVAVIPVMQRMFYHTLLQFLVGMAVGSLSGDALLHLLPHAMAGEHIHNHERNEHTTEESMLVWRGLVALFGVYIFFLAERLLNLFTAYYRRRKSAKAAEVPKLLVVFRKIDRDRNRVVGEKLSHHRQSSCDCNADPANVKDLERLNADPEDEEREDVEYHEPLSKKGSGINCEDTSFSVEPREASNCDTYGVKDKKNVEKLISSTQLDDSCHMMMEKNMIPAEDECHKETLVFRHDSTDHSYVVTMTDHHHHHGHSHEVPTSVSGVAWMVILGDGLHNFCDGLAIGAAFASGISGGLSTTIAVFCHELPHELGDFAMLLKAGMSVKQALLYNGVSSILCFIGMVIGVAMGNVSTASMWIFAGAAGMFLYIALVDMLPELGTSSTHLKSHNSHQLVIQVLGISSGASIMLLIAVYEHDLMHILS